MPYIYKITNNVNQKIYIGKTYHSIEGRWKQHCKDMYKRDMGKRPLYDAMRKYGVENFSIELVEETDNLEEREKYWIEYYGSFKDGYNATIGGDGRPYLDHDLIIKTYQEIGNVVQVAKILHISKDWIYKVLHSYGIDSSICKTGWKAVAKVDIKTNEVIEVYPSVQEAERANGNTRHIAEVCKGKRKTCKGYKWKYI